MREKLIKQYHNKNFYIKMFDESHKAVFEHMFLNSWTAFKDTEQFQQLVNKVKKDPKFIFSHYIKKMKLRYNIQPYKALNEGFEFHNKALHPLIAVENLFENLIQLLSVHYKLSEECINLKNLNSNISFQKFTHLTAQLKTINLSLLKNEQEKLCFFVNVYNLLSLHSLLSNGTIPHDKSSWSDHFKNSIYLIDGVYFSLSDIFHGILRSNSSPRYNSNKNTYFKSSDERNKYSLLQIEPMIHFATIDPYRSTILKIYRPKTVMQDLKKTTISLLNPLIFSEKDEKIVLPKSFNIYEKDFHHDVNVVNWLLNFFDISLMSEIIANQNIKFATKILKNPKLIINFTDFSIYESHFSK
ncbi:electron carrier/ protein disulfide oxidoreductase [Anaeramoeba flamelloides]|uniref:Electron carrier/ protein disulfide oxidoreductase n=1 Tax=Anaeramoeba flamelloides TaxID=1746091 RepID=A0ABQ8Y2I3_9EUKA|nr:electron carrier/ protein disulfide oxidoreductase [Anaeramoeba flamelloides]